MASWTSEHKQDLIVIGVVVAALTVLSVVAVIESRDTVSGGLPVEPAVRVVVVKGKDEAKARPASGDRKRSTARDDGTWRPKGSVPPSVLAPEGPVEVVELEEVDLDEYDVILPGGLILPRKADGLVPSPPRGLLGLAVLDGKGRIYYASADAGWTTLWVRENGRPRTLWCGETGDGRFEIAGLAGDEIVLVRVSGGPLSNRREAWDRDSGFFALQISKPGLGPYPLRMSRDMIDSVLECCD